MHVHVNLKSTGTSRDCSVYRLRPNNLDANSINLRSKYGFEVYFSLIFRKIQLHLQFTNQIQTALKVYKVAPFLEKLSMACIFRITENYSQHIF